MVTKDSSELKEVDGQEIWSTRLRLGLKRIRLVLSDKGFDNLLLITCYASKKLLPNGWFHEDVFQFVRLAINILAQERKRLGFGLPVSTTNKAARRLDLQIVGCVRPFATRARPKAVFQTQKYLTGCIRL